MWTCPKCHLRSLIARGSSGGNDGLPLQDPFSKGSRACKTHGMRSGEEMSAEILCQELICLPQGLRGQRIRLQCRKHRGHAFNPWVWENPLEEEGQPTPAFLPGKSHGQRSLVSYNPWGHKESDTTEQQSNNSNMGIKESNVRLGHEQHLTEVDNQGQSHTMGSKHGIVTWSGCCLSKSSVTS